MSIATPDGLRGLGGDVPALRAVRGRAARARRRPAVVLELDALPAADAGVRRGLDRRPVLRARRVAEPRVRRPARDGDRLSRRQLLHLHLGQPGHRPGEDRRARRVLPEARRPLLRELGRAVREVADEDGDAAGRAAGGRGPGAARVRAGRDGLRRRRLDVLQGARRLLAGAADVGEDVAAPLRVPAARVRRVSDVQRLLQAGAAGHPRPAHRADGGRDRRAPVQARRRAAPPGPAGGRHRASRPRSPTATARPRSTPSWRRATPGASGSRSSRASRTRGST